MILKLKYSVLPFYLRILTLIYFNHEKFEASKVYPSVPVPKLSNKTAPISGQIVGGKETGPSEFKFIVRVGNALSSGAGAILGPKWIITGRHMIVVMNKARKVQTVREQVAVNPKYTNDKHENAKRKSYLSEKLFCHPLPEERKFWWNSDIALIKLSENIPLGDSDGLKAIQIASNSDTKQLDLPVRVAGWGKTDPGNHYGSRYLMAIDTVRAPDSECDSRYNNLRFPQLFCAGTDGRTVCQGDSGGPIIAKSKSTGNYVLVGTVMGGTGDCRYR